MKLRKAIYEETEKVFTAFITWGLGIFLMIGYSSFVYWLSKAFNVYVMILGGLAFLSVIFFIIDLWWSYSRGKTIRE